MSVKYSLVVATCGRKKELELLLQSLVHQTIHKRKFEVIIVDQNRDRLIDDLIARYKEQLQLIHIKSTRKGLSYNRNLGIRQSSGTYISVPDDDCTYYPDSLEKADAALETFGEPDMLIGRVYNRNQQKFVFKKTPANTLEVNTSNFHSIVSSISLFFKKGTIIFDEDFGIGEKYPSNEDGELILHFLTTGKKVFYTPSVEFNHPPYSAANMPVEKLYAYGIGFGAMCKKYASPTLNWLYFKVVVFQCLMILKSLLALNFTEVKRRRAALKGRIKGHQIFI